ncbi:hypothetical protein [Pontibacter harenae]|uniref:hypothetical protein n=1 Tax=Pontibacter harenae TaxID=2894083 RepID=UPI001E350DEA|nr:hypothetical protein [Pontibacter harenae]
MTLAFSNTANAQTTTSATTKDPYWGTPKTSRGASADAIERRSRGLDTSLNTYDNTSRKQFAKKRVTRSKRMEEIDKQNEQILKKRKKDKKRLARRQKLLRRNN